MARSLVATEQRVKFLMANRGHCEKIARPETTEPPRNGMTESKSAPDRAQPRNLLGVLAFLRAYPSSVLLSVLLLLVNLAVELSLPQILGRAITQLRWHIEWGARFDLPAYVLLFVALVLIRAGNGILLGPIRNRLIQRTLGDIRAAIYDSLQRLAFCYHDRSNSGELISRSTTDVLRLQDFLFACLFLSFDIAVAIILTVALIFATSLVLGVLTLLTLAPTIALIAYFASRLQPQWRKVHDLHGAMTTVIQENIAGVRVVKAFARESAEVKKFRDRKEKFLGTLLDTVNYWAARVPFAQFIFGIGLPLALWTGGRQVIRGDLVIGDLAKIVFYLMAIGHRVGMVGQFTNILQNASASAARILEIIHEPQVIKSGTRDLPGFTQATEPPVPPPKRGASGTKNVRRSFAWSSSHRTVAALRKFRRLFFLSLRRGSGERTEERGVQGSSSPPSDAGEGVLSLAVAPVSPEADHPQRFGHVEFDHVSFNYSAGKASLADVSFEAKPGQTIAVVGPTGSGKTTLVNLIPRFYDASSGRVFVDGVDVRELKLGQLRRSVSVIFQETFLFSATMAENIAYGRPGAGRKEIEASARAAQAHEFITELDDGYDTVVGERGVTLSGGQKQRVAIARAFLMNPRILILDDATASVDSGTERLIRAAMSRLSAGRTTLVIAHRFSTVQHADQILVMNEGSIVERGTHNELIERGGFYGEIVEQQLRP
jgi:ABC-type multidrug transport system fused ATPase/permease subunit